MILQGDPGRMHAVIPIPEEEENKPPAFTGPQPLRA